MNHRFFPLFFFTALAMASLIGCTPSPEEGASSVAKVETDPMGLDSTSAQVLGVVNDLFQARRPEIPYAFEWPFTQKRP